MATSEREIKDWLNSRGWFLDDIHGEDPDGPNWLDPITGEAVTLRVAEVHQHARDEAEASAAWVRFAAAMVDAGAGNSSDYPAVVGRAADAMVDEYRARFDPFSQKEQA